MKLDDAIWGALFALLGAAILWHVQGFPRIPGQNVGPALFPGIVATALARLRRAPDRLRAARAPGARAAPPCAGSRRRRGCARAPQLLAFAVLVAVNVFYLLVVDRLGFLLTAFVYLAALMWVLRVRLALVLPVALVMTLLIHYAFYKLLRVPLPWGVLQAVAW